MLSNLDTPRRRPGRTFLVGMPLGHIFRESHTLRGTTVIELSRKLFIYSNHSIDFLGLYHKRSRFDEKLKKKHVVYVINYVIREKVIVEQSLFRFNIKLHQSIVNTRRERIVTAGSASITPGFAPTRWGKSDAS